MKKGLGRGLGALLDIDGDDRQDSLRKPVSQDAESLGEGSAGGVVIIDIRKIEPNRHQPRQYFDETALAELAESIKAFGVIQPLIVKDCGGHYSIIAGERRYRAARMAKMSELPVIIKDYTEMEILQIALIENIQRQDLTPIEEASCYRRLIDDFFFTQESIAEKIGKSRFAISATVRLLELDMRVQTLVGEGRLTASHAHVLLSIKDGDLQYACAQKIVEDALSVRGAEVLADAIKKAALSGEAQQKDEAPTDENRQQAYRRAEDELKTLFGAKVNILQGKKKGKIEIEYYTPDELDRLLCLFKSLSAPPGETAR